MAWRVLAGAVSFRVGMCLRNVKVVGAGEKDAAQTNHLGYVEGDPTRKAVLCCDPFSFFLVLRCLSVQSRSRLARGLYI